jgi:Cu-Zn family superoxide dismutase
MSHRTFSRGALFAAGACIAGIAVLAGVAVVSAGGAKVVGADGPLVVFADPYGNGTANPTQGGSASVHSVTTPSGKSIVMLHVSGLAPNRSFGAHVHVAACENGKAGGHYRNDPAGPATAANEVWLDFTTNAAGQGRAQAVVDFGFRPDGANAVVVHDHETDAAGAAGPKLGCINVDF